jgi:hypothetical protein
MKGESLEGLIGWLDARFELNCWLPLVPGVIETETQTMMRAGRRARRRAEGHRGLGGTRGPVMRAGRRKAQGYATTMHSNGWPDPTSEKSED